MMSYFLYNTYFHNDYSEVVVKAKARNLFLHVCSGKQNLHSMLEYTYLLTGSFSLAGTQYFVFQQFLFPRYVNLSWCSNSFDLH